MTDPKSLRIVFMGTPGFAVASLEKLVNEKYNVVAVVTVPDKPAGRGQKLQESEVKQFAVRHNIPVLQPEKLKAPEFLEQLKSYRPDLQIVVAFRMLPEVIWQFPALGTFNLHGSLLPDY
ncbi:MAG TPA: methionyl-tRNA formyltransferase, partial [Bacteroidia bacterium]|nr:methionyl-tRNA formyltransferase [Bacteroidia bacterium]